MGMAHAAHNPDSWEGWHWGAMPMWGNSNRLGVPEQYDLLEDALKHTEMVVFWSSDPESTGRGIHSAFESTSRRFWMQELGIKMVFVNPYYTPTAELFSDKWFAPRLGTDFAIGLALTAIRDNELAAQSSGVNIFRAKLYVYLRPPRSTSTGRRTRCSSSSSAGSGLSRVPSSARSSTSRYCRASASTAQRTCCSSG